VGYAEHNGLSSAAFSGFNTKDARKGTEGSQQTIQPARANIARNNEDVADTDHQWQLQQKRCVEELGGRAGNSGQDVADTDRDGTQRDKPEYWQRCGVEQGSKNVANTSCKLREWDRRARDRRSESPNSGWWAVESNVGGMASRLPYWLDGYWRVEPNIPRVATGVKNRVDRLKCLGNAVVPQQVYPILKAIAEIERSD
jgi:hypothetical protein